MLIEDHVVALQIVSEKSWEAAAQGVDMLLVECAVTPPGRAKPFALYVKDFDHPRCNYSVQGLLLFVLA